MTHEHDEGLNAETSYTIRYQLRQGRAVLKEGEAFGGKAWLDQKQFGKQNAIKRVKSALGMKWSTKTKALDGYADDEIARQLDDGRTLHIWVDRPSGERTVTEPKRSKPKTFTQEIERGLFDDAAIRIMMGDDTGVVAQELCDTINTYDIDEPMTLQIIRDVLQEM